MRLGATLMENLWHTTYPQAKILRYAKLLCRKVYAMAPKWKIRVEKLTDEKIEQRLGELERKYGMDSATFLLRFNTGELDDRPDFINWSGLLNVASKVGVYPRSPV